MRSVISTLFRAYLAVPIGIAFAVAILTGPELWAFVVEVTGRLVFVFADTIVVPIWIFLEQWVVTAHVFCMHTLLYESLRSIGLLQHTSFTTFCVTVYGCVALQFWLLHIHAISTFLSSLTTRSRLITRFLMLLGFVFAMVTYRTASELITYHERVGLTLMVPSVIVYVWAAWPYMIFVL